MLIDFVRYFMPRPFIFMEIPASILWPQYGGAFQQKLNGDYCKKGETGEYIAQFHRPLRFIIGREYEWKKASDCTNMVLAKKLKFRWAAAFEREHRKATEVKIEADVSRSLRNEHVVVHSIAG